MISSEQVNNVKTEWVSDIAEMHTKFGVNEAVEKLTPEVLKEYLKFRADFLQEELDELNKAMVEKNADDVVDALLDLCVVAIGTLDAFKVDADLGWHRIKEKNMQKEPGSNPNRPNKYGLPDMVKPQGWTPPSHADNVGLIVKAFEAE